MSHDPKSEYVHAAAADDTPVRSVLDQPATKTTAVTRGTRLPEDRARRLRAHQVLHNRESSMLQHAMHDRLMALGWSPMETIDDSVTLPLAASHAPV
ncbi:hypothetical protein [Mesorhizobium sp. M7A.T.Ca.TU.009.02.1.1]|uniref:hypothetical protein n=1 Tax=Mesorhizobium sp. M7A.T.Ca.TU.009.02.1.1 TaxID=2496791 RepID=UPI001FE08B3B|nr:hypothetical protein [Mesorhizobium sp. M7A.T.Ca.TU.009.02.1.1]